MSPHDELWQLYFSRPRRRQLAVFDLDGVLADDRHRQHHALAREWGDYFGKLHRDGVWARGRELYDSAELLDWEIMYLTGRREDTRPQTLKWLKKRGFDHRLPLMMRPLEDRSPLARLKAAIMQQLAAHFETVLLYDDDPSVIEAVGSAGRHCTWHIKPARMIRRALT